MDFFSLLFGLLLVICIGTEYASRQGSGRKHVESTPGFRSFQTTYLVVYLINMGADWLQGPYIYALYEYYGFRKDQIAILFLCGFFSSMVFGTFVGSVADKYGRKNMAIMFGVLYGLSCITKLWGNFYVLLLGRLLGGVSTSLLFSVFESWMVYEHHKRGYSTDGLSQTFSYATFGNGCVAILASLSASFVADRYGLVAPYMLSLVILIFGITCVVLTWTENYGDATVDVSGTFTNAISALQSDVKILILGLVQSLFEASMYTFVFMWTPALTEGGDVSPLPFGSSLFKICVMKLAITPEVLAKYIFGVAALSLFIPTTTTSRPITAVSFIVFEITCGMYWPCLGTIRGKYIPESSRSAIMNFFRVPLNLLVVIVLIKVSSFSNSTVFLVCTTWLLTALGGQYQFTHMTSSHQVKKNQAAKNMQGKYVLVIAIETRSYGQKRIFEHNDEWGNRIRCNFRTIFGRQVSSVWMYKGLIRPKQKVFVRGGAIIPAYSRLGRLLVGKPRHLDASDKFTLKGKTLLRSNVSRNQRTFISKPLPRPAGGAIKGLAEMYAWGEGANGQLGLGDTISKKMPGRVAALSGKGILYSKNINSVSCGLQHAGVVNSFGEAFTWGSNFFMQVGHEHSAGGLMMALDEREPTPGSLKGHLPKGFTCKSIVCGGWHTLLLGDVHTKKGVKRAVYAWGNGGQGQLGLVEKEKYHVSTKQGDEEEPRPPLMYAKHPEELPQLTKGIKDPERIVMIAAGAVHSVALNEQGEVYWWGENRYVTTPQKLDLLSTDPLRFKTVACGAFHTLGVTEDGKVYSWGAGRVNPDAPVHAQLDPHMVFPVDSVAPPARYRFSQIEIDNVESVAAADDASLALTYGGDLYFWRGTMSKPKQILQGVKIVDYAISWTHIAAVTEKGALFMWRMEENKVTPDSNKAYRAQWEDPATRDTNYVGSVPLPPFRGGRKGHVPHIGSLSTPLHFSQEPCASTVPMRIRGVLARKSVVGIRLGWNFAIATAVQRRVGPRIHRDLLALMVGKKAAEERREEAKRAKETLAEQKREQQKKMKQMQIEQAQQQEAQRQEQEAQQRREQEEHSRQEKEAQQRREQDALQRLEQPQQEQQQETQEQSLQQQPIVQQPQDDGEAPYPQQPQHPQSVQGAPARQHITTTTTTTTTKGRSRKQKTSTPEATPAVQQTQEQQTEKQEQPKPVMQDKPQETKEEQEEVKEETKEEPEDTKENKKRTSIKRRK